jgi:hypothetical protein
MKSQSMSAVGHVISGVSIPARVFHFAEAAKLGKQKGGWARTKKNKLMTQPPTKKGHNNTTVINLSSTPQTYREVGRGLGGSKRGGGQRVDHVEPFKEVLPTVSTGDITVLKGTTFKWIEPPGANRGTGDELVEGARFHSCLSVRMSTPPRIGIELE